MKVSFWKTNILQLRGRPKKKKKKKGSSNEVVEKKFIQCYWLFTLCLVSIKFPSFVYCAVSLQRNCKFSAFLGRQLDPMSEHSGQPNGNCTLLTIGWVTGWGVKTHLSNLRNPFNFPISLLICLSQASTFYFFSSVCYHVNKQGRISAVHWQHNKMGFRFQYLKNGLLLGFSAFVSYLYCPSDQKSPKPHNVRSWPYEFSLKFSNYNLGRMFHVGSATV